MEPRTYAFLLEIATLMQENICLETLVLLKSEIRIEHCFEAISALQPNTTVNLSIFRATTSASIIVLL
jgi:metal-responsive CopG/Arc/MetJ family transcriptional regulator